MTKSISFEQLLQAHLDEMFALALRLSGHKETAEDLVQDLFVNLRLRNVSVQQVQQPRAWLASILYRQFVDHCRREKRRSLRLVVDSRIADNDAQSSDSAADPVELVRVGQDRKAVQAAFDRLSDEHRHVLILHDIQGYTLVEIAVVLGISLGTVKSRLHRAREKLSGFLPVELKASMQPSAGRRRSN